MLKTANKVPSLAIDLSPARPVALHPPNPSSTHFVLPCKPKYSTNFFDTLNTSGTYPDPTSILAKCMFSFSNS